MNTGNAKIYEFGPYRLNMAEKVFERRDGKTVSLTPKAFEILAVLVEKGSHVVDKDELHRRVWPDTAVNDENITVNIHRLRRELDPDGSDQTYIETVPKRGYRFVAPIRVVVGDEEPPSPQESSNTNTPATEGPAAEPGERRWRLGQWPRGRVYLFIVGALIMVIAVVTVTLLLWRWDGRREVGSVVVIPFNTLNLNKDLGQAVTAALVNRLRDISGLNVMQPSADTKEIPLVIAREQGADTFLKGSICLDDNRVIVIVELVQARDGRPRWSGQFKEPSPPPSTASTVHKMMAENVTPAIVRALSDRERTPLAGRLPKNDEAYNEYQIGLNLWNQRTRSGLKSATLHFDFATANDPNYALAWAYLANSYVLLNIYTELQSEETARKAMKAAEKALELDDGLAEAHAAMGAVNLFYYWDWQKAEQEFNRAIKLNPYYATAYNWNALNHVVQGSSDWWYAKENIDKAFKLYPDWNALNPVVQGSLHWWYAKKNIEKAFELDPDSKIIDTNVGWIDYLSGSTDLAIARYKQRRDILKGFRRAHLRLGFALIRSGKYQESLAEFKKAYDREEPDPLALACQGYVYAVLRKGDELQSVLDKLDDLDRSQNKGRSGQTVTPYGRALICMGRNDIDEAIKYLEEAYDARSSWMIYVKVEPAFAPLRSHQRYMDLLRLMKLEH